MTRKPPTKGEQMMFNVQRTIKQNTEDIQTYVKDIGDWQAEMT